jgi:hypothetical protein
MKSISEFSLVLSSESLTTRYYASLLLYKMRAQSAKIKVRNYLGPKIRTQNYLLKIAVQFALWFKMEHTQQPCVRSVESTIETIDYQVRDIFMSRIRTEICDSQEEFERTRDLINLISYVMIEELGYKVENLSVEMQMDKFYAIDEVFLFVDEIYFFLF